MTHKIWVHKNYRVYSWICLLGLIAMLMAVTPSLAACFLGEPGAQLTVENRLNIDVTIIHEAIYSNGEHDTRTVAVVPVGQTVATLGFTLSQDIIGDTILLKAVDQAGNVVWQKSWLFEEFLKLEEVEWKIVVSPETSS